VKKSIAHLPEVKQKELQVISEVILEMVPTTQLIVLYGSFARGDWVKDRTNEDGVVYEYCSDFDIMVVTEDKASAGNDRLWQRVEDRLAKSRVRTPLSLIAHYVAEVNRKIEEGYYFFLDVKKEGILLFDTKKYELSEPKEQDPVKLQATAKSDFDHWYSKAKRFHANSQFSLTQGWYGEAAFLLHQSAEHAYHATLLVFYGFKPKLHNLSKLGRRVAPIDPEFNDIFPKETDEQRRCFNLLRDAYVEARYRKSYTITKEDLEYLAPRVMV
jgi:HEPN domain-containing protein/predicted nucleotidyltransferase